MKEYATTRRIEWPYELVSNPPPVPVPPEGEGWRLAASCSLYTNQSTVTLLFFWERECTST